MLANQSPSASGVRSPEFAAGFLVGLLPAGLVAGVLLLTIGATAVARALLLTSGYAMQHAAQPVIFAAGLVAGAVGAVASVVRVFARMRQWAERGEYERAQGSRWGLIVTAALLVLPVVLAILLPQHPAVAR